MPDPIELLAVARTLAGGEFSTDAHFRRAVSTAYYAVFHKVVRASADRFVGVGLQDTAAYSILYRSFDHAHMRSVCGVLRVHTLNEKYRRIMGKTTLSPPARNFAEAFQNLQRARHLADYDPKAQFLHDYVTSLIDAADIALSAFDQIDPTEQVDILALLMVTTRS